MMKTAYFAKTRGDADNQQYLSTWATQKLRVALTYSIDGALGMLDQNGYRAPAYLAPVRDYLVHVGVAIKHELAAPGSTINAQRALAPAPRSHKNTHANALITVASSQPPSVGGIPEVSVHLPLDPLPNLLKNIKVKWPLGLYQDQPFADQQYSKLYDRAGSCYVMTSTMTQGGVGKLRWAFNIDLPHLTFAIKELRHVKSRERNQIAYAKTKLQTRSLAREEAKRTVRLRGAIEAFVAHWDALPESDANSLKKARMAAMPFTLFGRVSNTAKTYLIMSKDAADAGDLAACLPAQALPFAVASLWAQMASELQALHEAAGYAHLDISITNIFFTRSGQFKLMDFGRAEPLENGHTHCRGLRGTVITPEAVGYKQSEGHRPFLSCFTDVFSAAVVVAHFACYQTAQNIFLYNHVMAGCRPGMASYQKLFHEFAAWQVLMADPVSKKITANRVISGKEGIFTSFFRPLARANADVCEMILNDVMSLGSHVAPSTATLAQQARALLPKNTSQRDALIALMCAVEEKEDVEKMRRHATMYHLWEQQQMASYTGGQ